MIVYPTKIDQPSGWFAIHLHPNKLWVENSARFVKTAHVHTAGILDALSCSHALSLEQYFDIFNREIQTRNQQQRHQCRKHHPKC